MRREADDEEVTKVAAILEGEGAQWINSSFYSEIDRPNSTHWSPVETFERIQSEGVVSEFEWPLGSIGRLNLFKIMDDGVVSISGVILRVVPDANEGCPFLGVPRSKLEEVYDDTVFILPRKLNGGQLTTQANLDVG